VFALVRVSDCQPRQMDRLDHMTAESSATTQTVADGVGEETARDFVRACADLRVAAEVGDRWLCPAAHQPPRGEAQALRRELEVVS
jgi:hypothetical protein